jgi:hypothetical protein
LSYPLLLTLSTEQLVATCDLLLQEAGLSRRQLAVALRQHPELLLYGAPMLQVRLCTRGAALAGLYGLQGESLCVP